MQKDFELTFKSQNIEMPNEEHSINSNTNNNSNHIKNNSL